MHNNNTKTKLTHDAMLHEDMIAGQGIAILKPVQYIQRVPKILFGCLHWFEIYLQVSKITFRGQKSIWYIRISKITFLNKYKQPNKIFGTLCMYCIGLSIAILDILKLKMILTDSIF